MSFTKMDKMIRCTFYCLVSIASISCSSTDEFSDEIWTILNRKLALDSVASIDIRTMSYDQTVPLSRNVARGIYDPFAAEPIHVFNRSEIDSFVRSICNSSSYRHIALAGTYEAGPTERVDVIKHSNDTIHLYFSISKWGGAVVAFDGAKKITWRSMFDITKVAGHVSYLRNSSYVYDFIRAYAKGNEFIDAIDSIRSKR